VETMKEIIRIAAIADLHCTVASQGNFQGLFLQMAQNADVILICGDLTDYGLPEEAQILVKELAPALKLPILVVLGNHDFESGQEDEVVRILSDAGITILNGGNAEFYGIGFAGAKGFIGGFGHGSLQPWGESSTKRFVHEAVEEALKLETALARLRTPQRVALLHYAPIQETVEGEPPEIFPFLGSSRLEEPLNRYPVNAVFHGHAHRGSLQGMTRGHVPVHNAALPLLRRTSPDRPFHVLELPVAPAAVAETTL